MRLQTLHMGTRHYKSGWILGARGGIGAALSEAVFQICEHTYCLDKAEAPDCSTDNSNVTYLTLDCGSEEEFLGFAEQASRHVAPDLIVICSGAVINKTLSDTSELEIDDLVSDRRWTSLRAPRVHKRVLWALCLLPRNIIIRRFVPFAHINWRVSCTFWRK